SDEDYSVPVDKEGEAKMSADGELLGGRVFKVRTFKLARHPTKLYMLTLDVARALGFRDSYLLHLKNPQIRRLFATDEDKQRLEAMDLLASNFRSRPLGIMSTRTVFKHFGYLMLVRGKPVRDDYMCTGKVEPENWVYPEDENDRMSGAGSDDEDRGIGDDSETAVSSTEPISSENATDVSSSAVIQVVSNPRSEAQMLKAAASAAEFNSRLRAQRRRGRFLDIHTNVEQVPQLGQPSHVLIEKQLGGQEKGMVLEVSFGDIKSKPASSELEDWMAIKRSQDAAHYPISIMPGQYQAAYSVHDARKSESDAVSNDGSEPNVAFSYDQTPAPPTPTARMVPVPKQVSVIKQLNTNPNATPGGKKSKASNLQDMECAICHGTDPPDDEFDPNPPSVLLRCAECGLGHHLTCADIMTPVMVSKVLMPGAKWKCGNCKMCEVCNKAGEDETLMVLCDACDKGYHTYCLNPKMDKAPSGSWHCPGCRICISCNNSATTMDWRHVSVPPSHEDTAVTGKMDIYACTYCAPCHKRFLADQFCPLCFHVYKEELEDIAMACCDVCDRWIHVGCDPELSEARYKKLDALGAKYTCVLCTEGASKVNALIQRLDKTNRSAKPSKLMMYHGKYLVVPPLMKRPPEKT
ncbi:chromatin remodelling complex Rsc7/Swp82 subunit-domain-containing protein, partial [Chytriomyces cf. hyalinus JEL632]